MPTEGLFPEAALEPAPFSELAGWKDQDFPAALATFIRSCRAQTRSDAPQGSIGRMNAALKVACARANRLPRHPKAATARSFFEREFVAYQISALGEEDGFLTGYYEPEVEGSRTRTDEFSIPLYRRPLDLISEAPPADGAPSNRGLAFREVDGERVPYHDRASIDGGALANRGLEVAFVRDPADAFFAQIQGSIRIRLPDGDVLRLNYDGHNGQPYTPIGRILIEKDLVPREKMSMDAIRAYIAAHPQDGRALMQENRSYVFFRVATELKATDGAVGGQGIPLDTRHSIAIDRRIHAYGTPFYITGELPTGAEGAVEPFHRLTIAQDTGSAIVGPARADIFFGAGAEAGSISGRIQHPGTFVILLPRALDPARRKVPRPPMKPEMAGPALLTETP